ncbi:transmembrane protein 254-like, partial [Argonauta hians]
VRIVYGAEYADTNLVHGFQKRNFPDIEAIDTENLTLYLKPSVIPFDHLGRFGDFLSYLDQQKTIVFCQFVFTCFAHTSEALYSLILTRKYNLNASETIQWFILVLVYGMFCLRYLKPVKDKTT